jgi:hypothetical protein
LTASFSKKDSKDEILSSRLVKLAFNQWSPFGASQTVNFAGSSTALEIAST